MMKSTLEGEWITNFHSILLLVHRRILDPANQFSSFSLDIVFANGQSGSLLVLGNTVYSVSLAQKQCSRFSEDVHLLVCHRSGTPLA